MTARRRIRARRSALLAGALLALSAPAASASTASVSGGSLTVSALAGEANRLTVVHSAGSFSVTDAGAAISPGTGCTAVALDRVTCPASVPANVRVDAGDMADTVSVSAAVPASVLGGAGDDSLTGGPASDALAGGDGDDVVRGGAGADSLAGGTGRDTADYGDRTAPLWVDDDGVADDGEAGERDNVGADVDDLIGGSGNDSLTGSGWHNALRGGAGDDVLSGRDSADTLDGGPGADVLRGEGGDDLLDGGPGADWLGGGSGADAADYSARSGGVDVSIGRGADDGAGGEGDDVSGDVERVAGGAGPDRLRGDARSNVLEGGPGDDVLDGDRGSDVLSGGDGTDAVDYSERGGRLTVDLDGNADDGEGERDNARPDLEIVLGGRGDDRLTGEADGERLAGGAGDDVLDGAGGDDAVDGGADEDLLEGGAGADLLAGGDGQDTADWSDRRGGVTATLDGARNDGEPGEADDVGGDVEHLRGGHGDDHLGGSWAQNVLDGGGGRDVLAGAGGDDALEGDDGDDLLQGGAGADELEGGGGSDTIDFSERGEPVTVDLRANGSSDGDRFGDDVENAAGGAGPDRVVGGDGQNALAGGDGDDTIDGGGGADRIAGGAGADTVDYSARRGRVRVTLGGAGDSGQEGERDAVAADVEAAVGGAGDDELTGGDGADRLDGGQGRDAIDGRGGDDALSGGAGNDHLRGGAGRDRFDAGAGDDAVESKDKVRESPDCGAGADVADADRGDKLVGCERRGPAGGPPSDGTAPTPPPPDGAPPANVRGVRTVVGGGKFVAIPGFPGERIDRRLLKDVAWMRSRFRVAITDGFAMEGHAANGEHPIGLAVDIVPGPGGTWDDIDRLARWAEPRQNRPRAPFRWVGYNGDRNHGRGNHLHLSWNHAAARRGRPARWVQVLDFARPPAPAPPATGRLDALAKRTNPSLGRVPSVDPGLTEVSPCSGAEPLMPTWRAAAKAFGLRWEVRAAITQIESGLGCNMGPSSAGALGWTQFMPATWRHWGMDASGDGKASPYDARDAVYSSARYLRASGAPKSYRRALFAYNHANWYVNQVLALSRRFRTAGRVERAASAPGEPLAARGLPREQTALPRS